VTEETGQSTGDGAGKPQIPECICQPAADQRLYLPDDPTERRGLQPHSFSASVGRAASRQQRKNMLRPIRSHLFC
jgi:hypothetical protein